MKSSRLSFAAAMVLAAAFASCSNDDNGTNPADKTAPARVTDLTIVASADSTLTLQWTAPGDDGHSGTAKNYEFRRSAA
ncbi:MAG TPA: hypothetical protein VN852_13540, partial [Candidatus Krumholzibacteria bacterium]|nr:hypothetical protein [Candidatus Krumholzibacteria bacterium]